MNHVTLSWWDLILIPAGFVAVGLLSAAIELIRKGRNAL